MNRVTHTGLRLLMMSAAVAGSVALAACEEEGATEKAGESIDKAAEQASEAVKEAGETMKDAVKTE